MTLYFSKEIQGLQQTKAEYDRNTQPLLPRHLQVPNHTLRQYEDGNIREQLDAGRCHLDVVEREALARDGEIVDGRVGDALQIQGDDNADACHDLQGYQADTAPVEVALRSVAARNEHAAPLEQDRDLHQGKDDRVTDTENEDPLLMVRYRTQETACEGRTEQLMVVRRKPPIQYIRLFLTLSRLARGTLT